MNKKIGIILASIIGVAVLVVGGVVGAIFFIGNQDTEEVLNTINNNQDVISEVLSDYESALSTPEPNEEASSEEFLEYTNTIQSDLEAFNTSLQSQQDALQKGPNADTEEIYELYVNFINQAGNSSTRLIEFTDALSCFYQSNSRAETIFTDAETIFAQVETSDDPTVLANGSRTLSQAFSDLATEIGVQESCFESVEASQPIDPTTKDAMESLSTSYNGLADALEANDEEQVVFWGDSINTILNAPNVINLDEQFDGVLDDYNASIDSSLEELQSASDAIDVKFNEIAEKYGFTVETE